MANSPDIPAVDAGCRNDPPGHCFSDPESAVATELRRDISMRASTLEEQLPAMVDASSSQSASSSSNLPVATVLPYAYASEVTPIVMAEPYSDDHHANVVSAHVITTTPRVAHQHRRLASAPPDSRDVAMAAAVAPPPPPPPSTAAGNTASVEEEEQAIEMARKGLDERVPSEFDYKDLGRDLSEIQARARAASTGNSSDNHTTATVAGGNTIIDRAYRLRLAQQGGASSQKQPSLNPTAIEILSVAVTGEYKLSNQTIVSVRDAMDKAVRDTKHYHYTQPVPLDPPKKPSLTERLKINSGSDHTGTRVDVRNLTTIQAALSLAQSAENDRATMIEGSKDFRVGILNFASATTPGGGFLNGYPSQETALCNETLLYPCLDANYNHHMGTPDPESPRNETYYHVNQREEAIHKGVYTDCALVSPLVPIVRNGQEWLTTPLLATIVTLPAPNRNAARGVSDKELDAALEGRVKRALDLFILHKCTHLVLGSYGCGVFGNPPKTVAHTFKRVLSGWKRKNAFEHVTFAILARNEKERETLNIFVQTFLAQVL